MYHIHKLQNTISPIFFWEWYKPLTLPIEQRFMLDEEIFKPWRHEATWGRRICTVWCGQSSTALSWTKLSVESKCLVKCCWQSSHTDKKCNGILAATTYTTALIHNNTAIYYSYHTKLLTNLHSVTPWNTTLSYPMEYIFSIRMILCSLPTRIIFATYVFHIMQDQGCQYMDVMESQTK